MHHISKVTDLITFPARTAVGAARFGIRTTGRVLGWAAEQVVAAASDRGSSAPPAAPVTTPAAPAAPVDSAAESATPAVDPMLGTRTPPAPTTAATTAARTTAKKAAPRKKVPAGRVPLKSAPTPSLTPALEAFDEAHEAYDEPAAPAARKTPPKKTAGKKAAAKKAAAKKAPVRKAPSKQAAVLAPALGLSEDEVADVVGDDPAER